MATSIVQKAVVADVGSSACHSPGLQDTELSHGTKEENMYSGNISMFTSSSKGSFLTKGEAQSPVMKFDYSKFDTQSRQTLPDSDGNQSMSYLDQMTHASWSGADVFDKNLKDSVYQQKSHSDQFSLEALIGSSLDSCKNVSTPAQDKISDKWDYTNDYSCNLTKTKNVYETSKQKYDQFPAYDLKSGDFQSKLQNFDFELMKQTYNFDTSSETTLSVEKDTDSVKTALPSRPSYDFEASDLAMRLRTSVQSNFLSSEFRQESSSKSEDTKYCSSSALRTIDDILKQYGISNNVPHGNNKTFDEADKTLTVSSQMAHSNVSQNSETSAARSACSGASCSSSLDKDRASLFSATANTNMNTSFRPDPSVTSSYLDSKIITSAGTSFTGNICQSDQSTYKSQGSLENDPFRKLGMYSGNTNVRPFDYKKSMSMSFSGDNSRASTKSFSAIESKQFEGNLDLTKYQGSQADLGKPNFGAEKGSHLDLMKNLGSTTDSLEYSMLNERQRLRKLDTMISATPITFSSMELPKSLKAQFLSPERSYSTLRPGDLGGRRGMYSNSTMPLSAGHGAGVSHKNSMSSNIGQRESATVLSKSISVPGSGVLSLKASGKHSSSVDVRAPYWPYSSKDYNMPYSSAYNQHLGEKKQSCKNQKSSGSNKKECPFKSKKGTSDTSYNSGDDNLPFYRQSSTGINFLTSTHGDKNNVSDRKKYATKSEMKISAGGRKNSAADYNQSKNVVGMYDGFDFVKDINRIWQDTVFGTSSSARGGPNQRKQQKYTPYKPFTPSQNKKDEKAGGPQDRRETFCTNYSQSSAKRSESNWAVNDSAAAGGKHYGCGSGLGLKSVQKVLSQCSVVPQRSSLSQNKTATSSSVKQKSSVRSGLLTKQATTAPKSILKHPSNKAGSGLSTSISRPHSAMAASSKSFTQSASQLPYHLIRGFSPVDIQKSSRSQTSAMLKKKEPSAKRKPASRTSATPRLVRHV